MKLGAQFYSIRDLCETPEGLRDAFRRVKEIGYDIVQISGIGASITAKDIAACVAEFDLPVTCTHMPYDRIVGDTDNVIAENRLFGCDEIGIGGLGRFTEIGAARERFDALREAAKKINAAGMTFAFHNHSGEFVKTAYGKLVHEELQKRTSIEFEIDTFWAFNAGLDPVKLITDLKDRIRVIHLKDGFKQVGDVRAKGMSLGSGEAPVAAVREKALELGFLMVVESETQDPTGPAEVERCINYLKALEA